MRKYFREFQKTGHNVLILLAGIQIVSGILWMILNMGSTQDFLETKELLEISKTMVTDEYVGIIYPVLLRFFGILEKVFPVPYFLYLYVLQIGLGYYALYRLLDAMCGIRSHWAVVWVMTIPTVMQLHVALLPQSLAVSLLMLCLVCCVRCEWFRGGCYWLLSGLLIPEYLWFAGMIYVLMLIRGLATTEHRRNAMKKGILCMLLVCLMAAAVKGTTQETYSRGRMMRTPASMALLRTVWPNYATNSYFWNLDVQQLFDLEDLVELAGNPELPVREFGTALEQSCGIKRAQEIYWYMAKTSFRVRTKEITLDVLNDMILYSIPVMALPRNLKGWGVSYSGWNYSRMAEQAPVLTKYYVCYSGNVMGIMLIFTLIRMLVQKVKFPDKKKEGKNADTVWLMAGYLIICALQILWYTLSSSGMQDYRNVLIVSMGWGFLTAKGLYGKNAGNTDKDDGKRTGQ